MGRDRKRVYRERHMELGVFGVEFGKLVHWRLPTVYADDSSEDF